jgi:hypothetical protein
MLKAGIIDPTKVTRVALENAASVAGMILTTECALIDIKEENRWRFNGWRYARNDVKSKKTYYIKSSRLITRRIFCLYPIPTQP